MKSKQFCEERIPKCPTKFTFVIRKIYAIQAVLWRKNSKVPNKIDICNSWDIWNPSSFVKKEFQIAYKVTTQKLNTMIFPWFHRLEPEVKHDDIPLVPQTKNYAATAAPGGRVRVCGTGWSEVNYIIIYIIIYIYISIYNDTLPS